MLPPPPGAVFAPPPLPPGWTEHKGESNRNKVLQIDPKLYFDFFHSARWAYILLQCRHETIHLHTTFASHSHGRHPAWSATAILSSGSRTPFRTFNNSPCAYPRRHHSCIRPQRREKIQKIEERKASDENSYPGNGVDPSCYDVG